MRPDLPYLEITGPEGQQFTCELSKERLSIGRLTDLNDIAIEPDPQQLVTRMAHCSIERLAGGWWVVDNGSVNKTFLRSAGSGRSSSSGRSSNSRRGSSGRGISSAGRFPGHTDLPG